MQALNPRALTGGYGLAEATVTVSATGRAGPLTLDAEALRQGFVVPLPADAPGAI